MDSRRRRMRMIRRRFRKWEFEFRAFFQNYYDQDRRVRKKKKSGDRRTFQDVTFLIILTILHLFVCSFYTFSLFFVSSGQQDNETQAHSHILINLCRADWAGDHQIRIRLEFREFEILIFGCRSAVVGHLSGDLCWFSYVLFKAVLEIACCRSQKCRNKLVF